MPNGVFYGNSATRFAEITDGLSNTGFYGERVVGDGTTGIISPIADVFFDPGAPLTPDDAMAQCLALNIYNPANQIPMIMGVPWIDGQHIILHVTTPNTRSCGFFIVNRAVMPPSSTTPAGSTCSSATARSSSSRTRSTCKPGVRWGPETAAKSSARTVTENIERMRGEP